ncbi:hypothetical protein IFM89_038537 [Coptis chinensis]|uniref:Uncharacterized protein n=1 Tax=Coptis chinensis TaxID=261450 RepID=A0A835LDQ7_9MAGN|nr:hypothetical protein IFM89_038537 [Coptis chinensis]
MYNPVDNGEVALTEEEKAERIKGLTKEIQRTNTRFHGKSVDSRPKEEDTIAVDVYSSSGRNSGVFFIRWKEKRRKLGKIEGTPLRSNREDTPVGIGGSRGPQFSIAYPSPRDVKAHSLSRGSRFRKTRERSKMFETSIAFTHFVEIVLVQVSELFSPAAEVC